VGGCAEGRNWPSLQSSPLSFRVLRTYVAHGDNLVRNGVCAVSRAGVDAMDVIDAAANSVLLDDSDTHGWFCSGLSKGRKAGLAAKEANALKDPWTIESSEKTLCKKNSS